MCEVLRQGVLRPTSAWLELGLRLFADMVFRCCPGARAAAEAAQQAAEQGQQQDAMEVDGNGGGSAAAEPAQPAGPESGGAEPMQILPTEVRGAAGADLESPEAHLGNSGLGSMLRALRERREHADHAPFGPKWAESWWSPAEACGAAVSPKVLLASSDMGAALRALLSRLLPLLLAAGGTGAEAACCLVEALTAPSLDTSRGSGSELGARLRQAVPEGQLLLCHLLRVRLLADFPESEPVKAAAPEAVAASELAGLAPPHVGAALLQCLERSVQRSSRRRYYCGDYSPPRLESLLRWWLRGTADAPEVQLERARVSPALPLNKSAWRALGQACMGFTADGRCLGLASREIDFSNCSGVPATSSLHASPSLAVQHAALRSCCPRTPLPACAA